MLIDHVDLGGALGPGSFDAVLVGQLITVNERAGRRQLAGHHGRTSSHGKLRRR